VYSDRLGGDFNLIVKTQNLQIVFITRDNKVAWKHEDSLSQIKEVQFFDYKSLEAKDINPYFDYLGNISMKIILMSLDEHKDQIADIPTNIMRRINAQSTRLVKWVNKLAQSFSTLSKLTLKQYPYLLIQN